MLVLSKFLVAQYDGPAPLLPKPVAGHNHKPMPSTAITKTRRSTQSQANAINPLSSQSIYLRCVLIRSPPLPLDLPSDAFLEGSSPQILHAFVSPYASHALSPSQDC
jgi:hypothetical protein